MNPFLMQQMAVTTYPCPHYKTSSEMAAARLSKPQMKGLLHAQIKKNLIVAIGLSILGGIAVKYGLCEPRKKRYAEFYRNYNPEAEFEKMLKAGVDFQCVPK